MTSPLIAIVGSYDPARANELSLKNIDQSKAAGLELGRELARQGCHVVVYASYPYLLEVDVVSGYVEIKKPNPEPDCIQVHYSANSKKPSFVEEPDNEGLFKFKPDINPEWEISFYASLQHVDGLLMLGGGPSSMIAGVTAMGYGKPIVPVPYFGGYAYKIWGLLRNQQGILLTTAELLELSQPWNQESAKRCVELLLRQNDQLARQAQAKEEQYKQELERQRETLAQQFAAQMAATEAARRTTKKMVTYYALVSAVFLVLALAGWGYAWGHKDLSSAWLLTFLIAAPLAAGISGSTIQVVFGTFGIGGPKVEEQKELPPVVTSALMGLVGGGITMVLYIMSQFVAIGNDIKPEHYQRLIT